MRFVKVFGLILVFFLAMVFFVQNTAILSQTMALEFNLFVHSWRSVPLPFYFIMLMAFLVGCLFTLFFFATDRVQMHRQLKNCRQELGKLKMEVNSLRNLPLEDPGYKPQENNLGPKVEEIA